MAFNPKALFRVSGTLLRYLFCCSYTYNVASKGKYIAFVTTEVETDNPEVELKPGIDLLGPVDEIFFETYDRFVPTNNHDVDNCFISMSHELIYQYGGAENPTLDDEEWSQYLKCTQG
ncbi:hypothetical protein ACSBR1_022132 [Camellia fascicularis]